MFLEDRESGFPFAFLRLSASCVRKLYEEFCEWIRHRGQELDYVDLDNQLSEYLREKYFEGTPRSFAVSVVKAVKFEAGNKHGLSVFQRLVFQHTSAYNRLLVNSQSMCRSESPNRSKTWDDVLQ